MISKKLLNVFGVGMAALAFSNLNLPAAAVWLDDLDVSPTTQDWGNPGKNQSVDGHPLIIGAQTFKHGLGTHAQSVLFINLKGAAQSFSASVGVDGEVGEGRGSVEFSVIGNGKNLWQSGVMKGGEAAKHCSVILVGVTNLILKANDAQDGISYDHADWADAKFEMTGDTRPETMIAPAEPAVILTPAASPKPRINGAEIFGVRPVSPVLFTT